MSDPLLSVCLITYNHVKYIKEAIDGVLMQKVSFPWELIIADDCSTDGTREIILEYKKKYPDFIRLILQEKNVGAAQNWYELMTAPNSKYIAYFEGDDYWTDPLKLEKQVGFLEKNSEYGMCHSNAQKFNQNKKTFTQTTKNRLSDFENVLTANPVITLTSVFRKDLCFNYFNEIRPENHNWLMGDYPMWLWFSYNTKSKYLNYNTGVYRVLQNSASNFAIYNKELQFLESTEDIKKYFIKKFNFQLNSKLKKKIRSNYLLPKFSLYLKHNLNLDPIYKEISTSKIYSLRFMVIRISKYSLMIRSLLKRRFT